MSCCLPSTGQGLPVVGWGMSYVIVDATAGFGGSQMTISARTLVVRFATWNSVKCDSIYLFIYIVYSQHAPLPSVILHALPDHLHTVLLVSYRIYIPYVWFSCSCVM